MIGVLWPYELQKVSYSYSRVNMKTPERSHTSRTPKLYSPFAPKSFFLLWIETHTQIVQPFWISNHYLPFSASDKSTNWQTNRHTHRRLRFYNLDHWCSHGNRSWFSTCTVLHSRLNRKTSDSLRPRPRTRTFYGMKKKGGAKVWCLLIDRSQVETRRPVWSAKCHGYVHLIWCTQYKMHRTLYGL